MAQILEDLAPRFVHFGISQALRSAAAIVLDAACRQLGVPLWMVSNTPLKGRFIVYEGIHRKIRGFSMLYNSLLKRGLSQQELEKIESYKKAYVSFKESHKRSLKQDRKQKGQKIREARQSILHKITDFAYSAYYGKSSRPLPDMDRPFVLALLSKPNGWISNYALCDFTDDAPLIDRLRSELPKGHSLVIKDHPYMRFPNRKRRNMYEMARKHDNVFYTSDFSIDTDELVKKADCIFSIASTSGVESLIYDKKLLTVGAPPFWFQFDNPPAHVFATPEAISAETANALKTSADKDKINAYITALLALSSSYLDDVDESSISIEINERLLYNQAKEIYKTAYSAN